MYFIVVFLDLRDQASEAGHDAHKRNGEDQGGKDVRSIANIAERVVRIVDLEAEGVRDAPDQQERTSGMQPHFASALSLSEDHQNQHEGHPLDEIAVTADFQKQLSTPGIANRGIMLGTGGSDPNPECEPDRDEGQGVGCCGDERHIGDLLWLVPMFQGRKPFSIFDIALKNFLKNKIRRFGLDWQEQFAGHLPQHIS
jgi:hypothetical protein